MSNPEEMPVKIIVTETAGSKPKASKQVKIKPEPQPDAVEGMEDYQEVSIIARVYRYR